MKESSIVEAMGAKRNEALQSSRRTRFADHEARYTQACQEIERNLQKSLERYTSTITRYAKEYAVQALQSLMLRLLTNHPPGKLRFTLIDPTGLGKNVATFLQLADYDEQLISGKVWTKREQIAQQLAELSDHMENVIQQYLHNR